MRHLTRLHFENTSENEQYVVLVDHGIEPECNNPRSYSHLYGVLRGDLSDSLTLPQANAAVAALLAGQCFFKLPIAAHAVVDIYVPDQLGSTAPKVFDYQVFRAKKRCVAPANAQAAGEVCQIVTPTQQPVGTSGGPVGPMSVETGQSGPTGPTGICSYNGGGSGPCSGQTSIACPDPISMRASCNNGQLVCVQTLVADNTQ